MSKISIEVEEKVISTKEVELPLYLKQDCHYYKVLDNVHSLYITYLEDCFCDIGKCSTKLALNNSEDKEIITKEEFDSMFHEVVSKLTTLL
jgi:hypothetical protein